MALMKPCLKDLSGKMSDILPEVTSRVLDLAITPDGKRLVVLGRASVPTIHGSRGGSGTASRAETPAPTPPMTHHEKKIYVFNLQEKKLE